MPHGTSLVLLSALAVGSSQPLPSCEATLAPLEAPHPDLPRQLHNAFSGRVTVSFTVAADGQVHAPSLVSAQLQPEGRTRAEPLGYEAAVIAAVQRWRYPRRQEQCAHVVALHLRWSD